MDRVKSAGDFMRICLMRSLSPRQVDEQQLVLPLGATVADALRQAAWLDEAIGSEPPRVGVWGKVQALSHPLRDGDRVEVYRGLRVDPKQARRERYAGHQAKLSTTQKGVLARARPHTAGSVFVKEKVVK